MAYAYPSVADFKSYFVRDFPYGATAASVMDLDISNAMQDSNNFINPDLFPSQQQFTMGSLLLAAHFLVESLRASSQGIAGTYPWMIGSKGVGSVSESLVIPQRILDNPELAILSKTYYGAKYLMFILPQLTGVMFAVCGRTNP